MRITRFAIVLGATSVFAGGIVAVAATQAGGGHGPSDAKEVSGPSVGPAGQTGKLHYLENTARPYAGGAQDFGPFRLLPAGTQYIPRPLPTELADAPTPADADVSALQSSSLWLDPPRGFATSGAAGRTWLGKVDEARFVWRSPEGKTIRANVSSVHDWERPLDVYLVYSDSLISVLPEMISDHYAIVNQPAAGAAPNVGYVTVFANNKILELSSPDLDQDYLKSIVSELIAQVRP